MTDWIKRGSTAVWCVTVLLVSVIFLQANDDKAPNPEKLARILNKSPWVVGIWGIAGVDTHNPGMDAAAREQQRRARERLERLEKTNPQLQGASLYERIQDLRRLENTEGGSPANVKRTPAPLAVRWISAASMLDAIRQIKLPSGEGKAGDFEKLVNMTRRFHVLAIGEGEFVATAAPVVLKQIDNAELAGEARSQAYLALPDGRKIPPAAVALLSLGVYQPTPLFLFPRNVNGEPTIGPYTTTVTFHYDKLDLKFDLRKMTADKKPDL
jgi:hypothetical protein